MFSDCYVITTGEVLLLQGLSSDEYNGTVAVVEGVSGQRVVVRLLHNMQKILVKPDNLLEAGGNTSAVEDEGPDDTEDCCDYDSDGVADNNGNHIESDSLQSYDLSTDLGVEELNMIRKNLTNTHLAVSNNVLSDPINENMTNVIRARQQCIIEIKQNPDNWVAYEILGEIYSCCGNDVDAILAFTSQTDILQKSYPASKSSSIVKLISSAFLKIAAAKRRMLDTVGELDAFMQVSLVDPSNVHVLASIGDLLLDSGDVIKAVQYFHDAVRVDPSWALGRFHLARVLVHSGDSAAAAHELRVATGECDSKRPDESTERAAKTFMMIAGMIEQLQQSPSDSKVAVQALLRSVNLLRIEIDSEIVDEEDSNCRKLLALVYCQLGQALERQGKDMRTTISGSPAPPASGYHDGAISSYKKACELDSVDSSYRLALGNALRLRSHAKKSNEDLEDSVVVYNSGLLIDAGNAALHRNLACSLMQQGKIAQAISSFTSSLQASDEDDDPWRPQIESMIRDLTEKLRLHNLGTIVVDLPR